MAVDIPMWHANIRENIPENIQMKKFIAGVHTANKQKNAMVSKKNAVYYWITQTHSAASNRPSAENNPTQLDPATNCNDREAGVQRIREEQIFVQGVPRT